MSDSAVSTAPKPRRLHWLQFSLRGFVVLMMLAAIVMAWWSYWHHRIRKQRIARQELAAVQRRLTKTPDYFIFNQLTSSTNPTPWWLRGDGEKTIPVTTGVGFDLRSNDAESLVRSGLRDRDLRMLSAFPYLFEVRVPRSEVGDEGLQWAKSLHRLQELDLSGSKVTDEDLAALADLRELSSLNLSHLRISGEGLAHLATCSKLTELQLVGTAITDEGAEQINRIQSLESLMVDSATLRKLHLHDLPSLEYLTVQLSGEQIDLQLERLPGLRNLHISLIQANSPQSMRISDMETLKQLIVQLPRDAAAVPSKMNMMLARLPAIDDLQLTGGRLPDGLLPQLADLSNVRSVRLNVTTGLNDESLAPSSRLPQLTHLELGPSEVTGSGVERLATINRLEYLSIDSNAITTDGLRALVSLPQLSSLVLTGAHGDEDPGPILMQAKHLKDLSLRECRFPALTLVGDASQPDAHQLHGLQVADCEFESVRLANLPKLWQLSLEAHNARTIEIAELNQLTRLDVSLGATQKVEQFTLKGLPQLNWMSIQCGAQGAEVPTDTFEHLLEFQKLKTGIVWGLKLSDEAKSQIERLRAERGVQL